MLRHGPARAARHAPAGRLGGLALLSEGRFRALLASTGASDLATAMRVAAQSWLVLELTDSSLWVGAVAGVRAVPAVLLALVGGVVTDRVDKRALLFVSRLVLGFAAAAIGLLVAWGQIHPWHLVLLSVAGGVVIAFHGPALWALVGDLVPGRGLASANGLMALTYNVGDMAGPAVAGAVIAGAGTEVAFWAIGGGYGGAALLLIALAPQRRPASLPAASILRDLRDGLSYARRTQPLPWLCILIAVTSVFGVAVFPLIPTYARDILDVGASGYGLLAGALGAGALAGAVAISAFGNHPRKGLVIVLSGVVWDAGMIGFGFSRVFPLSLALLFVMGAAGAYWMNAAVTAFLSVAGPAMRGRVMGLYVLAAEFFPLGWLYGGALASAVGNEWALVISACGGTPVTLLAYALSPDLRRV
ncbi:MAG: MFS transporter [Gemmatimonadetes bacterium]|nr:MFS transporter [Gemmatimonadota bacterium]